MSDLWLSYCSAAPFKWSGLKKRESRYELPSAYLNEFNKKDSEGVIVYLFKYMTGYCVSYKAHVS